MMRPATTTDRLLRRANDPAAAPGNVLADDNESIALQKLAGLGEKLGDGSKYVPVPFRYEGERPFAVTQADLDKATTQTVPLRSLIALEPVVKRKRVAQCIEREGPGDAHMQTPPYLVAYRGERYILDGTHRCTARYLLGEEAVTARIVTGRSR